MKNANVDIGRPPLRLALAEAVARDTEGFAPGAVTQQVDTRAPHPPADRQHPAAGLVHERRVPLEARDRARVFDRECDICCGQPHGV